jgi:hypothetical protein
MTHLSLAVLAFGGAVFAQDPADATRSLPELADPIVVEAAGAPIQVTTGHAAPFVVDLDNDGVKDLVVGQFDGGKARIYCNLGTDAERRFEGFAWLEADGEPASVPPS